VGKGRGRGRGAVVPPPPPIVDDPRPREPSPEAFPGGGGDGGASGSGGGGAGGGGDGGAVVEENLYAAPSSVPGAHPKGTTNSLFGIMVTWCDYINNKGLREPNWIMQCKKHPGCKKRRGCVFSKNCGPIEPLAFLHVWHEIQWPTDPNKKTHAQECPATADVVRFAEEHRDELLAICKTVGCI
jgi:hypothetical protein